MVDNRLLTIRPITEKRLRELGLDWYVDEAEDYFTNEMLGLSREECDDYHEVSNTLYAMYQDAAAYVVQHELWEEMGIPKNAIELIKYTFKDDRQMHLYGRFDFSGGIDNLPIQLIEFNADTATVLPETVFLQQEQLGHVKVPKRGQFNYFHRDLVKRLITIANNFPNHEPKLLISTLGHPEDEINAEVIAMAAEEAGFVVEQCPLEKVIFSPDEGIFVEQAPEEYEQFNFWFKLIPWEWIAYEEPELMADLTNIVTNDLAVILNPAFTMLYQSKAIMKYLWDLNTNHPLLLKTTFSKKDFKEQAYVKKVIFGREGENITIYDEQGDKLEKNKGDFGHYPAIYQAFAELAQDEDGDRYQPGVYFIEEASAISFRRRDGLIIDEDSEFIGHFIIK